jgi:MarR family transcriptional regulator for hemolysin
VATTRDRSDVFGQLLADVSKLWRHRLNVELKPLGLNCTLRSLLQELVDVGEGLMQRELAQRLGIESATLVGLVDTLSNAGWVERQVSTKDRRRKTVHLTRSGRRVLARSEDVIGKLRREMLNAIASKDLEVCIRVFRTMLEPHVATDASRSASSAVSSPPPHP